MDNLSSEECINWAKILSNHLATIGEPISNGNLIIYVLEGLGPSYTPFITSMNIYTWHITYIECFA